VKVRNRRILSIAGRSCEGALTGPTADAQACRWELVNVTDRAADRSKPPTNGDTERSAYCRPRSRAKARGEAPDRAAIGVK
jgi:hypothetical protein